MSKQIKIFCRNNRQYTCLPNGSRLEELALRMSPELGFTPVAAVVNNKLQSLNMEIYHPKQVLFVGLTSEEGQRVYQRTLVFLIAAALDELYPQFRFVVKHTVGQNLYCMIEPKAGQDELPLSQLPGLSVQIRQKVRAFINDRLPIHRIEEETALVIEKFREDRREDLVTLLSHYHRLYVPYYTMGSHTDYCYGPLACNTSYLGLFDLTPFHNGLLLSIPDARQPDKLPIVTDWPKTMETYQETLNWNRLMKLNNVGDLNEVCQRGFTGLLVKFAEALQEKRISHIADDIASKPQIRLVLVAGPSSSGKTTFSKRLSIQLAVNGLRPVPISLDDYFVEREQSPRDENGDYDFESLYALDLELFNRQLVQLLNGEEVIVPTYNFTKGAKEFHDRKRLKLGPNDILVLEGIHALNPELLPSIPPEAEYKIFVSAMTSLALDDHNRVSPTDNRMLRRIIRDVQYRGNSPQATIARWPSVRAGEEKWIFPFQEQADAIFNSALSFEIAVLKHFVEPHLQQVPQTAPEYAEAQRLLSLLSHVEPVSATEIPLNSLLREFVGGSTFNYA